jgi:hypothetical protein
VATTRETIASVSSPSAPANLTSSSQPVAQEIPVIASGARPTSASGNRELFTEATSTVLISENGAVIRLSVAVVPGQLLFLIHQESKREVVAQVLRKRSFRPTSCYVELQFTESAPNFWGKELPSGSENSQSKSPQSEAIAQVQSAKPTADNPRKPAPVPSPQEAMTLKQEVDSLRGQIEPLLPSKPGGANSPSVATPLAPSAMSETVNFSGKISPQPNPRESLAAASKLSRLPLDPSTSLANPVLSDTDSTLPKDTRNIPARRARRSHKAPRRFEGINFRRIIPFAAGLFLFAAGALWYSGSLPGFPSPAVSTTPSLISSKASAAASARIRAAVQKAKAEEDSRNTALTSKVSGGESSTASPSYQPDKTADRGSMLTVVEKNSAAVKAVKRDLLPPPDRSSAIPATAAGEDGIVPPKLLSSPQGIAPPEAVRGFVAGDVILDVVVGSDGRVISATVLSGRDSLRASAIEKVKQYRYQPAMQNGKRVSAHATVTIQCWFEP